MVTNLIPYISHKHLPELKMNNFKNPLSLCKFLHFGLCKEVQNLPFLILSPFLSLVVTFISLMNVQITMSMSYIILNIYVICYAAESQPLVVGLGGSAGGNNTFELSAVTTNKIKDTKTEMAHKTSINVCAETPFTSCACCVEANARTVKGNE